ncbi:MAG: hypothetical protein RIS64_3649 [Bacteroidota bacterium]|jgi:predicted  nucleic acid-binding Zn-ribbon protein
MSYSKVDFKRYDEHQKRVTLLSKLHETFVYSNDTSLASYQAAVEAVRRAAEAKNAQIERLNKSSDDYNAAVANMEKQLSNLRTLIGINKGKNSDEYVFAGGVRQSEVIAQAQQTRKQNEAAQKAKDNLFKTD